MEGIIIAILGSGVLSTLISCIFQARQAKKSKLEEIEKELKTIKSKQDAIIVSQGELEKSETRTQLMVLIRDYPDQDTDILRLAQKYFVEMDGNFVMTDIFVKWCKANGVTVPPWFKGGNA